jgi:hypothetical protein
MLFGVATRENISSIEEELLRKIQAGESSEYHRGRIIELVSELYENIGLHEDALRVMKEVGLEYKSDYLRLAKALIKRGEAKEAFNQVKNGVRLGEGEKNYALYMLYFELLSRFLTEGKIKGEEVEAEEPINVALDVMSHFRQKTYERIKLFVEKPDEAMLREVIEYAHNVSIARIFINALLSSGKRPEVWLLEKFASNMGKEEIKSYAMKLKDVGASEEAPKIKGELAEDYLYEFVNSNRGLSIYELSKRLGWSTGKVYNIITVLE